YEPIIKAAEMAAQQRPSHVFDPIERERHEVTEKLRAIWHGPAVHVAHQGEEFYVPSSSGQIAVLLALHPHATVVAGSTDVGLWVTKQFRPINPVIFIGGLQDLQHITSDDEGTVIGAGATY